MMPEVFEKYFALFGKQPSDFYQLIRLPVNYRVYYDTGHTYEITSSHRHNLSLFDKSEKNGATKLQKYLHISRHIYETAMKDMVYFDHTSFFPLIKSEIIFNIPKFHFFRSLHSLVKKYFKNPELQKIIEFTTVFLGGSPYNTPAFYSLVAHADFNLGIYYPLGGMRQIVTALLSLCQEYGVKIMPNQEAKKIFIQQGKAVGVKTSKKFFKSDYIVANLDYHHCETSLLPRRYQTYSKKYWEQKTLSPSAFIIYLGLNKKLKNISHHNLYFNQSWEEHFKKVFSHKRWPENPSYYVHVPSQTDDSLCPLNGETVMILVPVAAGLTDNEQTRNMFAQNIIHHLEKLIKENITDHIVAKEIYSHKNFIAQYNAYQGTAFGLAHTLFQTAFFRPLNKSKKISNLYYVGQYTNPGVGVPPCLISSQIVSNLILKDSFHDR